MFKIDRFVDKNSYFYVINIILIILIYDLKAVNFKENSLYLKIVILFKSFIFDSLNYPSK